MSQYDKVKAWRARPENKRKRAEEAARYRAKHPDKVKRRMARYRAKNANRLRELEREKAREWRLKNPELQRARELRSLAKKEAERAAAAGRPRPTSCEVCLESPAPKQSYRKNGDPVPVSQIVFDHCHASGKFRGWICDRCNKVLGLVKDSPDLLSKLSQYLKVNQ